MKASETMQDTLRDAVANLLKVKGRHNTELAYKRLQEAYDAAQPDWCPNPETEVPVGELIATETSTRVSVIGHYIAPGTYPLYLGAKK